MKKRRADLKAAIVRAPRKFTSDGAAVMINDHGTNQPPGFRDEECSP